MTLNFVTIKMLSGKRDIMAFNITFTKAIGK